MKDKETERIDLVEWDTGGVAMIPAPSSTLAATVSSALSSTMVSQQASSLAEAVDSDLEFP